MQMSEGPILQKLVQIKRINLRKILIDLSSKRDNFLASRWPKFGLHVVFVPNVPEIVSIIGTG